MIIKNLLLLFVLVNTITINTAFGAPPPGLGNFGNTCYLNATVQNLYNCVPLTNLLLSGDNIYPKETFAHAYVELIKEMYAVSAPNTFPILYDNMGQEPNKQLNTFVNRAYDFWETCGQPNEQGQMDAAEFISTVLNKLMEQDPRFQAPKYSSDPNLLLKEHPIAGLFRIEQASITRCPPSSFEAIKEQVPHAKSIIKPYVSTKIEYLLSFNLGIANFTTLQACLDNYFEPKNVRLPQAEIDADKASLRIRLTRDNPTWDTQRVEQEITRRIKDEAYDYLLALSPNDITYRPNLVPYNGKRIPDCTRKPIISKLNDIVIITLNRFEVINKVTGTTRKLGQNVEVDQVMNFGSYMADPVLRNNSPDYNLIGAVVHAGETLQSGHYIAYVKSGNQWYVGDDSVVMPITWDIMVNPPKEPIEWQKREVYLHGRGIYKSYAFFFQKVGTPSQIIAPHIQKKQAEASQPENIDLLKALTDLQVALDGLYASLL